MLKKRKLRISNMVSLEQLVDKNNFLNKGLINGDKLLASVKSSDEADKNTYFFTEHGDIYYHTEEGEFHQPVFNPHTNKIIRNDRTSIEKLNVKEVPFEKENYQVHKELADIRGIKLPQEPVVANQYWFREQLKEVDDQVVVNSKSLLEMIKEYTPTNASLKPFGRETTQRKFVFLNPDGSDQSYSLDELRKMTQTLKNSHKSDLIEEVLQLKHFTDTYIENLSVEREVEFSDEKRVPRFLNDHGLNNGSEKHQGVYQHEKKKKHFSIKNDKDQFTKISYEKVNNPKSFVRESVPLSHFVDESFSQKLKGWYEQHKPAKLFSGLSKRFNDAKHHIKNNAIKYGAGLFLAASTLGLYAPKCSDEVREPVFVDSVEQPVNDRFEVMTFTQEPNPTDSTLTDEVITVTFETEDEEYVVQKGDCLWSIAKEYASTNKEVLEKTNKLAIANEKLSIGDYEYKVAQGEVVSNDLNPNYLMVGDTIIIPGEQEVVYEIGSLKKEVVEQEEEKSFFDAEKSLKNDLYQRDVIKQDQIKSVDDFFEPTTKEEAVVEQEKKSYSCALPTSYEGITKHLVDLKNEGVSLDGMLEIYDGFNEETLKQAFCDYQGFVQAGVISDKKIDRFDKGIVSDDFLKRISHEYRSSDKSLKDLSDELSSEYGMNISASTISKYARSDLGVGSRKEAKFIKSV